MGSSTREVLRCLLEGLRWLWGAEAVKVAGPERHFAGPQPPRRGTAAPLWWSCGNSDPPRGGVDRGWRLVSLDGSCLDVADADDAVRGLRTRAMAESAFPQLRFVALVENGARVYSAPACATTRTAGRRSPGGSATLRPGVLYLADGPFFGYALWQAAAGAGATCLARKTRSCGCRARRCWPMAPT